MAFNIPTTAASAAQALSKIESSINQTSPLNNKAFNRVISVVFGFLVTGLYKFASERAKQNLVLTATGVDLERLGADRGVIRKDAAAAVVTANLPSTTGTTILPPRHSLRLSTDFVILIMPLWLRRLILLF